jgi:transposase, IS5 family
MALVDRANRGVQASAGTRLLFGHTRRLPKKPKKLLKRRQVVEPAGGVLGSHAGKGRLSASVEGRETPP